MNKKIHKYGFIYTERSTILYMRGTRNDYFLYIFRSASIWFDINRYAKSYHSGTPRQLRKASKNQLLSAHYYYHFVFERNDTVYASS